MKLTTATKKNIEIKVAQLIASKIHTLLKSQPLVTLAVPGGRSVGPIFSLLRHQNIPWPKVHIFLIDETFTSEDDPKNNYGQLYRNLVEYLFDNHKLPRQNTHPFIYHNLPNDQATRGYRNELKEISDKFDIILLSAGENSHVAVLHPNHETINSSEEFFLITESSPKPPMKRFTSSRKLLQRSQTSILLIMGESKRQALNNFNNLELSVTDCPAKLVNKIPDSYVLTDLMS